MKEQNHDTLQRAIRELPQYSPGEAVWLSLEQALDAERAEEPLREAIQSLPTYAPQVDVWDRIEQELAQLVRKPLFVRRWMQLASAAALVGVAVALAVWLNLSSGADVQETVTYAQAEQAESTSADWDADDALIAGVADAYAQRASFLQNEGRNLLSELEELDEAKAEIKAMMQKYGTDAQLVQNIVDIERERTEVVKQMAQGI